MIRHTAGMPILPVTHASNRLAPGGFNALKSRKKRLKFERSSCLGADATVIHGSGLLAGDTTGAPMPTVSACSATAAWISVDPTASPRP